MKKIHGDLANIRGSVIGELLELYDLAVPPGQLVTREMAERMLVLTEKLGREVAVYLTRKGTVEAVSIGDAATVSLPDFAAKSTRRLSGIRCVHTHPRGDTRLSGPDISSLRQMRFDCMTAIGRRSDESRIFATMGFFTGEESEEGTPLVSSYGPSPLHLMNKVNLAQLFGQINRRLGAHVTHRTEEGKERAVLAGIGLGGALPLEESMAELARLADTAGAEVVASYTQKREKPDGVFFLGKGKVREIALDAQSLDADLLIVDDEISPSQQRNLERETNLRVIDRTALILDIFAQRAATREGKLQVELAQLQYNLPRLSGQGFALSRLGGGIGTRGPGETKLEVDRRRIHSRIHDIQQEIDRMREVRSRHRARRKEARIPVAALVGYTNAGKSTLLNALTEAEVFAEDKLFATLDPTTRRLELDDVGQILLTDTVGFIQKLPHTLVSAFRATLEEVCEADILLHVVDASSPNAEGQIEAVVKVLRELSALEKPTIFVFNKADAFTGGESAKAQMLSGREGLFISARTGEGLGELKARLTDFFRARDVLRTLLIPFAEGQVLSGLHAVAEVLSTDYEEAGTRVKARIPLEEEGRFAAYYV